MKPIAQTLIMIDDAAVAFFLLHHTDLITFLHLDVILKFHTFVGYNIMIELHNVPEW